MILCCGEALIDMLPAATSAGQPAFAPHAGGAVFNTAIALGRLGQPVGMFTGLSQDLLGDVLRESLGKSRVDYSLCAVSSRPTTLAFVKLVDGHATYAFYDEGTAGRMITEADLPALDAPCEALHFGAISLMSEPCGSAYEALMARESSRSLISLDPNIRPSFITDKAGYIRRIRRMASMSDIVKFSDEDLKWFGMSGNEETLAEFWLNCGAKLVVITRGADGATGYMRQFRVDVPSIPSHVVDTVGAGDTFNAGLLASFRMQDVLRKDRISTLTETRLKNALTLASRVASVTVSRAGANPPFASEIGLA